MKTYFVFVSQNVYVKAESKEEAQHLALDKVKEGEWLCECIEATNENGDIEVF